MANTNRLDTLSDNLGTIKDRLNSLHLLSELLSPSAPLLPPLQALPPTRLFEKGTDEQLIMSRTGHHSVDGARAYKRVSDEQRQALSDVLNTVPDDVSAKKPNCWKWIKCSQRTLRKALAQYRSLVVMVSLSTTASKVCVLYQERISAAKQRQGASNSA